jgi:hypothetical protein
VHAALFGLKNGRTSWDQRTVLVVDEAAMLDSRVTGEVLAEARAAGAKVILTGDDRQLASIERGGLFTELRKVHGAAEITEVTRQKVGWQRQTARDLAEGRFDAAVQAFDRHGAVTWTTDEDASQAALVERWKADSLASPEASRFVFAYTNVEVSRLNAELRAVRRDRGELQGVDVVLSTKYGEAGFAVGDRVQFTDTAKKLGVYNGNAGVITGLDANTGRVTVQLDAAAGKEGRVVTWSGSDGFDGFRHGYAGTIYKGQGKTLDHTYLLHTRHWRAAASYVALTRQRESAQVFVATETARDAQQLARQMGRGEVKAASVAWATEGEVIKRREGPERDLKATPRSKQTDGPAVQAATTKTVHATSSNAAPPSTPHDAATANAWLIPPYVDPTGRDRDSLGRGVTAGEVAAAVAADKRVQLEREARWSYLRGAYKDPHAARAALDEMVKREGWTSAASRMARAPGQLGELRGKTGWLASGAAKQERLNAERAAGALPGSLQRIGDVEGTAERLYRASVAAQHAADRTGVPNLSREAEAALVALRATPDEVARGRVWHDMQKVGAITGEIAAFRAAVERRLGADSVRQMLRTEGRAGTVTASSVTVSQRTALDQVAERISTIRSGERAGDELTQRLGERDRLTRRRGLRM